MALFIAGQPAEFIIDFLLLLDRKLECEMCQRADRAVVIDRFFDAILIRVRQIERCAARGSLTLN
jgi:hypothetical protein